eukprot:3816128-Prorocentrum_lima.AAC.1
MLLLNWEAARGGRNRDVNTLGTSTRERREVTGGGHWGLGGASKDVSKTRVELESQVLGEGLLGLEKPRLERTGRLFHNLRHE